MRLAAGARCWRSSKVVPYSMLIEAPSMPEERATSPANAFASSDCTHIVDTVDPASASCCLVTDVCTSRGLGGRDLPRAARHRVKPKPPTAACVRYEIEGEECKQQKHQHACGRGKYEVAWWECSSLVDFGWHAEHTRHRQQQGTQNHASAPPLASSRPSPARMRLHLHIGECHQADRAGVLSGRLHRFQQAFLVHKALGACAWAPAHCRIRFEADVALVFMLLRRRRRRRRRRRLLLLHSLRGRAYRRFWHIARLDGW